MAYRQIKSLIVIIINEVAYDMPTKTQAIATFLQIKTVEDLANLYTPNMECQVNVAQDGGERQEGDYKGRKWHGWTDGLTTWKSFRIPFKAYSDAEFTDSELKFDLAEHAEGIGMTGWDWKNRVSKWVAFDFDAITGHSEKHSAKMTNEELERVREAASAIEWVTIRKSTGGKGLHIYVFLDNVPTDNHNEHAALARAILGKMSALTGFDFHSKVDICGQNMWVWHRKMLGSDGLRLLKSGCVLTDIPPNWKDHVKVVTGSRRKNLPQEIDESGNGDLFEELTGQRPKIALDEDHKKLINYLQDNNLFWWWDQDNHMLVTHTIHLRNAHKELQMKGFFATNSEGTNINEQNCFAYPLRKGAWAVRRYSIGVQEHEYWSQDGAGWTRCYLNHEPDLPTASRSYGGLENPKGGFVFREAEIAAKAVALLGVNLNVHNHYAGRETILKEHKDGRLIVEIERKDQDRTEELAGWLPNKDKWTRIYSIQGSSATEVESVNYDDLVRHLVTESNDDYGWMIKTDGYWRSEPLQHVKIALQSMNLDAKEVTSILGSSVFKCWRVVNKPFMPEYPGDREWNRNAAQFRFLPSKDLENLNFPTWSKLLDHCGSGLNDTIKLNGWCKANGIVKGGDYLKCWIASLFQEPLEPLPYLFMYGPQNSGKSIFHEALNLLLTKGYKRADAALISQAGFNAELEGAIIAVVEETDLRKNLMAYNRIKDWVTSKELLIHCKGKTPYHIPNATHWIQCANSHEACPIFSGDTRITMCYVEALDPIELIPKKALIPMLEKEAPDFIAEILKLDLPASHDRLNVPVITTEDKMMVQQLNQSQLEVFITEKCQHAAGRMLKFSDFFDKFQEWLDPNEISRWSKVRVGREISPIYPKGRNRKNGQFYLGNICWTGVETDEVAEGRCVSRDGFLEIINDNARQA